MCIVHTNEQNAIFAFKKITQPHTRAYSWNTGKSTLNLVKSCNKHYSKKKAIQSIKADQRSLEERKESVMNLQETE